MKWIFRSFFLVAFAFLIAGCSGGSSSQTPSPVATTQAPISLILADGRIATLSLQTQGNRAFGTLQAADAIPASFPANAPVLPFSVRAQSYPIQGSFTPPRRVDLIGEIETGGFLSTLGLRGTLPTATLSGDATIESVAGDFNVLLPALNGTISPPVADVRLAFTPSSSAFPVLPLRLTRATRENGALIFHLSGSQIGSGTRSSTLFLNGKLPDVVAGKTYTFSLGQAVNLPNTVLSSSNGGERSLELILQTGQIRVTSLSTSSVSLSFENVVYTGFQQVNGQELGESVRVNGMLQMALTP